MGVFQPKPFKRLNRLTGKFETVTPPLTESVSGIEGGRGGKLKINVRNIKP